MIERQNFIYELFQPIGFLNSFSDIEFENFKVFVHCYLNNYLRLNKQLVVHIPINSVSEFEMFVDLATRMYFCEKISIDLLIKSDLLDDIFTLCEKLKGKKFHITTDLDIKPMKEYFKTKGFKTWVSHNPLWINLRIDYNNYNLVPRQIAYTFNKKKHRLFKLSFDYESFERMTFDELHLLENWLYKIRTWITATGNVKEFKNSIMLYKPRTNKEVYITKELKLYVNKQAYEENEILFDFEKHLKDSGENILNEELNKLRAYIDLKPDSFTHPLLDHYFVDLYQNKKIMGTYNQVPQLVRIIGEIFESV